MTMLNILADENMPHVRDAFANLGHIHTVNGRHLQTEQLSNIDVLLVRSVTQVHANLLSNTSVQFVGSATAGLDHIDQTYLQQHGIALANAPGSNACSAAEYVISSLCVLAEQQNFRLQDKTVGIVGCGNVGSRLRAKLTALGVTCLVNDPPLQEQGGYDDFVPLTALAEADIITLHVPLVLQGAHPTLCLINADFLKRLRPDAIIINAARGEVMDETALLQHLVKNPHTTTVLDVWWHEPKINWALHQHATLATPHIAGYSLDAKVRGTAMLYDAVCQHFNLTPTWRMADSLPAPTLSALHFSATADDQQAIQTAVLSSYDVRRDHAALLRGRNAPNPAVWFDQLRKQYPLRREFNAIEVVLPDDKAALRQKLYGLGFT